MTNTFIIMRKEKGGYATRGPLAQPLTLEDAKAEILSLNKQYPHQEFEIFGVVGSVKANAEVSLHLSMPDLSEPAMPIKLRGGR